MRKLLKREKGITLIALIITIIVMLILVIVSVRVALNTGLFESAGKATKDWKTAQESEMELGNGKLNIGGTVYNSIGEYTAGIGDEGEIHNWTRNVDTFTCSHCNTSYTMGDVVNYKPAGKTSTTISKEMSGLDVYYTQNSTYPTYNAYVDNNGTQTIEKQEATWIVLGTEDTNKDGKNETLLITTQDELWTKDDEENECGIWFYGAAAYNNAVDEINRISRELYSNSEYGQARGMTIEDINSAFNFQPTGGTYSYNGENYKLEGLTTPIREIEDLYNGLFGWNDGFVPDGSTNPETIGDYLLNSYSYELDQNILWEKYSDENYTTLTDVERTTIFSCGNEVSELSEESYWLASKGFYASDTRKCVFFAPGVVAGREVLAVAYKDFGTDGIEYWDYAGLRPVVCLKSKLPQLK